MENNILEFVKEEFLEQQEALNKLSEKIEELRTNRVEKIKKRFLEILNEIKVKEERIYNNFNEVKDELKMELKRREELHIIVKDINDLITQLHTDYGIILEKKEKFDDNNELFDLEKDRLEFEKLKLELAKSIEKLSKSIIKSYNDFLLALAEEIKEELSIIHENIKITNQFLLTNGESLEEIYKE